MDNPDKLAILGTQDTGRRQTKQKHSTLILEIWYIIYFSIECCFDECIIYQLYRYASPFQWSAANSNHQ